MENPDLFVSNGTCYFAPGQVLDENFIPCGNAALSGPQSCCYRGDFCLSSGGCWDNNTIVTYTAGCTDFSYSASSCIDTREYPDQQWVAMARCNGDNIDIWSGCAKHPKVIEIQKENCDCNASDPLIRNPNGKSTLDEIASLPQTAGGTISFNPTAIPTLESTDSSSTSVSPSETGPSSSSSSGEEASATGTSTGGGGGGLSTGAKAGIGVGVGVGGLLIIGLSIAVFVLMRRRKKEATPAAATTTTTRVPEMEEEPKNDTPPPHTPIRHRSELSNDSTYTPELLGDNRHQSQPVTELQA